MPVRAEHITQVTNKHPWLWVIIGSSLFLMFAILSFWITNIWIPLVFCVLIVMGFAAVYVVKNPFPLIVLMAMGTYLGSLINIIEDGVIPFSPFQLFLILLFVAFLLNRMYFGNDRIIKLGIETELLLFLTLASISILYSPVHMTGVVYLARISVLLLMVYVVINVIKDNRQIYILFIALAAVSFVISIMLMADIVNNPQDAIRAILSDGASLRRTTITEIDPNRLAAQLLLPVAFVTSIMLSGMKAQYRLIGVGVLLILLMGIAGTYSRSVMLAAIVMMILIAVLYKQYRLFLWLAVLGLAIVLIVPELRLFAGNALGRLINIFAGTSDASSNIRIMLGVAGLNMFADSYMIGVGLGGFPEFFTNYFTLEESIGVKMPHNVIYKLLAELGLIGFLLYAFIIWKTAITGYRNILHSTNKFMKANSVTMFASFIALLIFYQFYGGALTDNILWLSVGLIFLQKRFILSEYQSKKLAIQ